VFTELRENFYAITKPHHHRNTWLDSLLPANSP
jgi:hypothetical protein